MLSLDGLNVPSGPVSHLAGGGGRQSASPAAERREDATANENLGERNFRVAFGYIRASRDHQKLTLESQRAMIQRWWDYETGMGRFDAQRDRLVFVEEPGVSASKHDFDKRPKGDYIIRMAKPNDTIVVSNYDRMFRSLKDCILLTEKLIALGINLMIMDTQFDTSTPIGKAAFRLVAVFKQLECEERSRRILEAKAIKREMAASGRPLFHGGGIPAGWRFVGRKKTGYLVPYVHYRTVTEWVHTQISAKVAAGEKAPSSDSLSMELARIGRRHPDPKYKDAFIAVSRKVHCALEGYLSGWAPSGQKPFRWGEVFRSKPSPVESLNLPVDDEE